MAPVWRCGARELSLELPLLMGIVNVTPDSFSDGGEFDTPEAALMRAALLVAEGADIIDVGGESTRPGAAPVPLEAELARVLPVVTRLAEGTPSVVSIDTRHAEVARACLAAGAGIINDVGGFRDADMIGVAANSTAGLVVMHMLGDPGTMQDEPVYGDVVTEVRDWLLERALALQDAGVDRERIALDPGIGFGKTLEHNLALLRDLPQLACFGYPVLVGASRKRFIGALTGEDDPAQRLGGSLASAVWSVQHGASIVRVHDVAATKQALRVAGAIAEGSSDLGS